MLIQSQNIPSKLKDIRMMFKAGITYIDQEVKDINQYIIPNTREVLTIDGWKNITELTTFDKVSLDDDNFYEIDVLIQNDNNTTTIVVKEGV